MAPKTSWPQIFFNELCTSGTLLVAQWCVYGSYYHALKVNII